MVIDFVHQSSDRRLFRAPFRLLGVDKFIDPAGTGGAAALTARRSIIHQHLIISSAARRRHELVYLVPPNCFFVFPPLLPFHSIHRFAIAFPWILLRFTCFYLVLLVLLGLT